ncbi:MAG TPA: hypothetical protein P5042_02295 [Candidatus Izemoplasmatales bacterium]|nr:hypothetical protein [Candidatus Izemoplasmatales bacterium]
MMKNKIILLVLYFIFALVGWFGAVMNLLSVIKGTAGNNNIVIAFVVIFVIIALCATGAFVKRLLAFLKKDKAEENKEDE